MTRYTKFRKRYNAATQDAATAIFSGDGSRSRPDNKVCLRCRQRGHALESCPKKRAMQVEAAATKDEVVCYKCGDSGHSVHKCPAKSAGMPFAQCFVCNQTGHLAKDCEKNENGIYPRGGCCHHCGSKRHFARDCDAGRAAMEPEGDAAVERVARPTLAKPKVVKF